MSAALNRPLITLGLILSAFMSAMDTTVANIALPHIQGSISASPEQITWVITSYFIAQAVTIPVSGWLAARFGLKPMLLFCVLGFTVTSVMCGMAMNLPELVLFRALQGVVAAPLMPVAQSVLININPPERLGRATALFTMAAVVAPAVGPVIGGWLTDELSWRWCFYINLPAGLLSMGLLYFFLPASPPAPRPFDVLGFASLGIAVSALQLMLDRGTTLDWFDSREIWIEASVAACAFWIFLVHSITARAPLFPRALLADRNFQSSAMFGFFFSTLTFTSFALLPLMMQGVLGYSAVHAGVLSAPRGILMLIILQFMGRVDTLVDRRVLIAVGLSFFVLAFWEMSRFDLSMDGSSIVWATIIQGFGQGILFVPLSTLGFMTIAPHLRPDAAAATSFVRNVGGSISVAVFQALTVTNSQTVQSTLSAHIGREIADAQVLPSYLSPDTTAGAVALAGEIQRQALMVAYVDDFRLLTIIAVLSIPLVLLIRPPRGGAKDTGPMPIEAH
ncbi:DHA2 family efflux MFS transporter permease subunit [Novosphingobium sp. G106]|uniref:DHA2 family efflux MFS transporter permease subunit n=1 Tax=Novosphingobium sp. G106 TaxID=2849500 RepID=UPI001C2D92C8|nr:DHA2 family efflux MFS transporter permease subunit [Novosphingobium sp. G106]MBV1687426.1 DHA2 family efflux MFS transporter permease subunit [Novosphingobium sp. G106]